MPCWYYDKKELKHTPSVTQGISREDETMYRREGARFILQLGNKMGLRYETMATGVVHFHRFYMIHSFREFPRHVTACCCLFLAGKVEETPKKCKDIMKHARSLVDDPTWSEFGADPREEVMTLERILLQTIKFDFIVEHPYTYLLKYAKCLKGDKKKLQNMVQMAWTFVNDGLCTTLCLQWEPEIIAIALMYLAGKLNKFEVVEWTGKNLRHQKWWDMFVQGISMDLLEDICHQVLDLYSPNKTENSTFSLSNPAVSTPVPKANRQATDAGNSIVKATEGGGKVQPQTPVGPPPAKKIKKEEAKVTSPAKLDTPVTQPFQQYPTYPTYPPNYPPPQATTPTVTTTPQRYSYPYASSTSQHPPPPQQTGSLAHLTPPGSYQAIPTVNRYPPSAPATPTGPPPHYTSQAPPPAHYTASHPPPFPPLGGTAPPPHYPAPPSSQHITPGSQLHTPGSQLHTPGSQLHTPGSQLHTPSSQLHTPSSQLHTPSSQLHTPGSQHHTSGSQHHAPGPQHHTPASLHHTSASQHHPPYSHYSTPSSYYQQGPPLSNTPSNIPTTYQQPPNSSYTSTPTNYSHSSRAYYPPTN